MTRIRDVEGWCPACGGKSLHLMPGGMLQCLNPQCQDQGAAQKLLTEKPPRKVSEVPGPELMAAIREEQSAEELFGSNWREETELCRACLGRKYKGIPCARCQL
jgi:hypothetical protein